MGNSKLAPPLQDVQTRLGNLPSELSTEGDWAELRERALLLSTPAVVSERDLLASLEPELVQNNLVLQSFEWAPSEFREVRMGEAPLGNSMRAFHLDEERSPLARGMTSRFFRWAGDTASETPLVVVHAPGFGPWCVRGAKLTKLHRRDVWVPRLPEHGIVNVHGHALRPELVAGLSRAKTWHDWLLDVRLVLAEYTSPYRFLVPWELLDLIEPMARVFGPFAEFETVPLERESLVYAVDPDWSPVPLQLEWKKLARAIMTMLDEGATSI